MYTRLHKHVTILDTETDSPVIDCDGFVLDAIQTDAGWNTANISFEGSIDGDIYAPVQNAAGTALSITGATASELFSGLADNFRGVRFVKIISGTAQTGDTVIRVALVPSP